MGDRIKVHNEAHNSFMTRPITESAHKIVMDPIMGLVMGLAFGVPGDPDLRHWLRPQRHLAMAWRRRRQRVALAMTARPGK